MKRCEYCGNRYSDNVSVCPADGHPTINPEERVAANSSSTDEQQSFDAKVISPLSAAGAYRIFVQGSDILFIKVESPSSHALGILGPLLGPLGGVVVLLGWIFSLGKNKNHEEHLHTGDPEDLLRESEANFKLNQAEIRGAVIEPIKHLPTSGKAGRLVFTVRHGEKIKAEFDSPDDIAKAIYLLTRLLKPAIKIKVTLEQKTHEI